MLLVVPTTVPRRPARQAGMSTPVPTAGGHSVVANSDTDDVALESLGL